MDRIPDVGITCLQKKNNTKIVQPFFPCQFSMPNTMVICIGWLLDFHWPAMCDCKFHTAWWSTLDVSSRGDDLMRDPKMSSSHLTSPNHIGSTCHVKINGRTVAKLDTMATSLAMLWTLLWLQPAGSTQLGIHLDSESF